MESLIAAVTASLKANPYFGAGAGLLGVGASAAIARRGLQWTQSYLRRRYVVSIEIPHTDKSYYWFMQWMSARVRETQHLSVATSFTRRENGSVETKFSFLPSVGNHFIQYKGTWILVERTRDKTAASPVVGGGGAMWESVQLRMFGRKKEILLELLQEAKTLALKEEEGRTIIYTSHGSEWRPFGYPRRKRPLASVILAQGLAESLIGDLKDFMSSSAWYTQRGIPYRRGYLLYGPPGSGKSSFIQALAGELGLNICMLSLSERGLTDDRLNHLLTTAPERSIILLEDVDACFASRDADPSQMSNLPGRKPQDYGYGYTPTVTFSGLLNALDGVAAAEGRVLFMTTNHITRLDSALIRPGRVDMKVPILQATREQARRLFNTFYPDCAPETVEDFMKQAPDGQLSMAQLTGYFLIHKDDPTGAVTDFAAWLAQQMQDQIRISGIQS
jgi:mitochondrial chaperone BCS1